MARRKKSDLESGIEKIIRKEIQDINEEEEILETETGSTAEGIHDQRSSFEEQPQDDPELTRILGAFPSSEGYYGKLYRKNHSGKLEFKYFIDHLEEIEDPELEVANLIREKRWKGGEYYIRIMKKNTPGIVKSVSWNIGSDDESGFIGSDTTTDNLQNMKEVISAVKEITGDSGSRTDEKTMADIFKSGIEVVKDMFPKQSEQNKETDLIKTIELFKSLGLLKNPSEDDNLKLFTLMKEMYKPKEEDFWAKLIQMKELGIIKFGADTEDKDKDDTFSSIEKITSLIELMKPLMGISGETSKPSIGLKLVEILGPQVPKIVENITSAVGKIADVSKMKLSSHLGVTDSPQLRPSPIPVNLPHTLPYGGEQPELYPEEQIQEQINTISTGEKLMNPLVKEIYTAVQTNNHDFFPKLKELITMYVGPHIFEVIISKQITIDSFLHSLHSMLQANFLLEENTKKYFESFLSWMVGNSISAKCDACGEIFDFETEEMFNQDSKICECGGALVKIETQIVGTA